MTQEEMKGLLKQAWKEVFQVEDVTDDADFFEVGGDSIMAVQLSAWLIQKGVKLDLADIFMASTFGEIAEKLVETEPVYIPEAMLTKEIAAKEMGFSSVEEAEAAEKSGSGFMGALNVGGQQVCTPAGDQQVCTPAGDQQVCTPAEDQQVCTPAGDQQVCTPAGNQQVCTPARDQQVCTPAEDQQVCTPMWNSQFCMPMWAPQFCMLMWVPQFCMPMWNQQICTPMWGQQVCTPATVNAAPGISPMTPPQIQKYLSHPLDEAVDKPNVIKINKAKIADKDKTPEEALMRVMKGLIPNFNKNEDFFAQGLTSFDTVKMVTRCGEAGYQLELKDIYMFSTFDELVKHLK